MVGNTNEAATLISLLLFASSAPNVCVRLLLSSSPRHMKISKGPTLDAILQILTPHKMAGNCLTFSPIPSFFFF